MEKVSRNKTKGYELFGPIEENKNEEYKSRVQEKVIKSRDRYLCKEL